LGEMLCRFHHDSDDAELLLLWKGLVTNLRPECLSAYRHPYLLWAVPALYDQLLSRFGTNIIEV
jgi:hypothetical protein